MRRIKNTKHLVRNFTHKGDRQEGLIKRDLEESRNSRNNILNNSMRMKTCRIKE